MFKLGKLELIEIDDKQVIRMAKRILKKNLFKDKFIRVDRSDKYVVCRVGLS